MKGLGSKAIGAMILARISHTGVVLGGNVRGRWLIG
jgi:hypothetical protein